MPDSPPEPVVCGDDLVTVRVPGAAAARRLADRLREEHAWREVVPGFDSVTVQFDPVAIGAAAVCERLRGAAEGQVTASADDGTTIEIRVSYGGENGPDLEAVCRQLGMTRAAFIATHTRKSYRVELLGFTPGFAYLGGLDADLAVERLRQPRQRVRAGAVGIAGAYTGLYALAGPGGWPIVGHTPDVLFDPGRKDPFRLRPGTLVRFLPLGIDAP